MQQVPPLTHPMHAPMANFCHLDKTDYAFPLLNIDLSSS